MLRFTSLRFSRVHRFGVSQMPVEINMPQLSDTMTEGTVVKWRKREGEKVKEGEMVAEIETDKAVMEYESFAGGTLAAILVPDGQKAPVGAVIAVVATGKENPAEVKKQYAAGAAKAAPASASASVSASAPAKQSATPTDQRAPAPAAAARGGSVATLEGASRGEVHEPENVGHGATRSPAEAVPPVARDGGNGHGDRVSA